VIILFCKTEPDHLGHDIGLFDGMIRKHHVNATPPDAGKGVGVHEEQVSKI
jgi:hypothetical protein